MLEITMRAVGETDQEFLKQLFVDVRRDEFEAAGIPAQQLAPLLSIQFAAQSQSYATAYPDAQHRIVLLSGERVGRLLTANSGDRTHLIDVSILRGFRGRGIGSFLLEDLKSIGDCVSLNVFKGNEGAIRLYERHGFRFTGDDGVFFAMEWKNA